MTAINATNIESMDLDSIVVTDKMTFTLSVEVDGKTGDFTFKVPVVSDLLRMGVIEAELFGGKVNRESVATAYQGIAFMLANLKVAITQSPEWFDLEKIYDFDSLEVLYTAYNTVVEHFRGKPRK